MHDSRRLTTLPDEEFRESLTKAPVWTIINAVLAETGKTFKQINIKDRSLDLVMARHIIHYLLSVNADRTFKAIGKTFELNHATAIRSRQVIEEMIDTNCEFKLKIINISTKIKRDVESQSSDNRQGYRPRQGTLCS